MKRRMWRARRKISSKRTGRITEEGRKDENLKKEGNRDEDGERDIGEAKCEENETTEE